MLKLADRPVAGRYARALFEAARAAQAVEPARAELRSLADLLHRASALAAALHHPRVPPAVKSELVAAALGAPSALLRRLFTLLLEKKRLDALGDVVGRYEILADEACGVRAVRVAVAVALTAEQTAALKKKLENVLGKVALKSEIDANLLSGMVVRMGDRLWDGSVAGQLARWKEDLLALAKN